MKVDRVEPHYLWGQVHVEFVYETWQQMGDATLPVAFRLVDGDTKIERVLGPSALAPADSAPRFALPPNAAPMGYPLPGFLRALPPDTIRVGASTFLLRNAGYAETVTLARDTVFVFDATQGDERARQDSAWVGRLFPGHHPIVVVVTDLAWPHVAGVRYWVAMGATIVSHAGSKEFLSQVVVRKWTTPDELERRRMRSRLRFIPVSDTLRLAGGDLLAFTLDGIGSETALAVFDRRDSFLWASDYIQTLQQPTLYLTEVYGAVERVRVAPRQVAAEHLPLSAWSTAAKLIGH